MLENTFFSIQFITTLYVIIVYLKTYHYQLGRIAIIDFLLLSILL